MSACQHRQFECIQVSCRGINKCITNFNRLTTVAHIIDALLHDLSEKQYLTINDCCLYVERQPYLFPLKSTEFIQDILLRYASTQIHFKLSFKRNASPSRFAQRKKLLRTPLQKATLSNPYEQLQIQESLIRRQHQIITQLRKTNSPNEVSQHTSTSNYDNYFDWVTQNDGEDSDCSRTSSDIIPICRRQSRQDECHKTVNHDTARSLSRVRFRASTRTDKHELPSSTVAQVKSILKKNDVTQRTSSVDRVIARLTSFKQRRNSVYTSDDADDDNLSDRSTTDSCLGSFSSDDTSSYIITPHQLETLV